MKVITTAECHVEPKIGMPVTHERPRECFGTYRVRVGEITEVKYLGNYRYQLTCEVDKTKLPGGLEPNSGYSYSAYVVNPTILLNEYEEDLNGGLMEL
jgi:hypothetical protein